MRHILIALGLALTLVGCAAIPPYYDRAALRPARDGMVCATFVHSSPGQEPAGDPALLVPRAHTVCMALLGWPETP